MNQRHDDFRFTVKILEGQRDILERAKTDNDGEEIKRMIDELSTAIAILRSSSILHAL